MRGDFGSAENEVDSPAGTKLGSRLKHHRETLAWIVVVFLLGVAVGVVIPSIGRRPESPAIIISTREPDPTPSPTETPSPLKVYVSGEIANPAVYELPQGAIV